MATDDDVESALAWGNRLSGPRWWHRGSRVAGRGGGECAQTRIGLVGLNRGAGHRREQTSSLSSTERNHLYSIQVDKYHL